jgi:hypothetical protein
MCMNSAMIMQLLNAGLARRYEVQIITWAHQSLGCCACRRSQETVRARRLAAGCRSSSALTGAHHGGWACWIGVPLAAAKHGCCGALGFPPEVATDLAGLVFAMVPVSPGTQGLLGTTMLLHWQCTQALPVTDWVGPSCNDPLTLKRHAACGLYEHRSCTDGVPESTKGQGLACADCCGEKVSVSLSEPLLPVSSLS